MGNTASNHRNANGSNKHRPGNNSRTGNTRPSKTTKTSKGKPQGAHRKPNSATATKNSKSKPQGSNIRKPISATTKNTNPKNQGCKNKHTHRDTSTSTKNYPKSAHKTMKNPFVSIPAHEQKGDNCYAFAVATGIREVLKRTLGLEKVSHEEIVEWLTNKCGKHGASIEAALDFAATEYPIKYQDITDRPDLTLFIKANAKKRVFIAGFDATSNQYDQLDDFFDDPRTKRGIFTKKLDKPRGKKIGHAVVIVGMGDKKDGNGPYYLIKNSYGDGDGDNGYRRVKVGVLPIDEVKMLN